MFNKFTPAFAAAMIAASAPAAANWPACGKVQSFPQREWRRADAARLGWDEAQLSAAHEIFGN